MIAEPLSLGADPQLITTLLPLIVVVGVLGADGLAAALTLNSDESVPKPTRFRAVT